ncbi:hypothetical protein GEMRC1_010651 [Eukaryota sp. GEM-RC1]
MSASLFSSSLQDNPSEYQCSSSYTETPHHGADFTPHLRIFPSNTLINDCISSGQSSDPQHAIQSITVESMVSDITENCAAATKLSIKPIYSNQVAIPPFSFVHAHKFADYSFFFEDDKNSFFLSSILFKNDKNLHNALFFLNIPVKTGNTFFSIRNRQKEDAELKRKRVITFFIDYLCKLAEHINHRLQQYQSECFTFEHLRRHPLVLVDNAELNSNVKIVASSSRCITGYDSERKIYMKLLPKDFECHVLDGFNSFAERKTALQSYKPWRDTVNYFTRLFELPDLGNTMRPTLYRNEGSFSLLKVVSLCVREMDKLHKVLSPEHDPLSQEERYLHMDPRLPNFVFGND